MSYYHAHFDCFSGAAGDMMLAACLDAADHLPQQQSCAPLQSPSSSQLLLARVTSDLERGMPELEGEFGLSTKRVWRSLGRIAARKVDVTSVYQHAAAPVPGVEMMNEHHSHEHEHGHSHQHHDHQHEHEHKHDHAVSSLKFHFFQHFFSNNKPVNIIYIAFLLSINRHSAQS